MIEDEGWVFSSEDGDGWVNGTSAGAQCFPRRYRGRAPLRARRRIFPKQSPFRRLPGRFLSPKAWLPLPAVPVGGLASHRPPWSWNSCIPAAWRGAQKGRTKVPPTVLQLQVLFGPTRVRSRPCAPPGVDPEPPRRGEGTFISSHPVICST